MIGGETQPRAVAAAVTPPQAPARRSVGSGHRARTRRTIGDNVFTPAGSAALSGCLVRPGTGPRIKLEHRRVQGPEQDVNRTRTGHEQDRQALREFSSFRRRLRTRDRSHVGTRGAPGDNVFTLAVGPTCTGFACRAGTGPQQGGTRLLNRAEQGPEQDGTGRGQGGNRAASHDGIFHPSAGAPRAGTVPTWERARREERRIGPKRTGRVLTPVGAAGKEEAPGWKSPRAQVVAFERKADLPSLSPNVPGERLVIWNGLGSGNGFGRRSAQNMR